MRQALRRELAEAYAEALESFDQPTKDAWEAMQRLIGGTEEDAERAIERSPNGNPIFSKGESCFDTDGRAFLHGRIAVSRVNCPPVVKMYWLWNAVAMLRTTFGLVTLVLISSSVVAGQVRWNETSRQEIEQAWQAYSQAFVNKDYDQIRDLVQVPFFRWSDGVTAVFETPDEVINFYRSAREPLDARGYKTSRADLSHARISLLSPTRVLFSVRYRRYKADGSLLEEGAQVYLMSKASGKWKVQGLMAQYPAESGKLH